MFQPCCTSKIVLKKFDQEKVLNRNDKPNRTQQFNKNKKKRLFNTLKKAKRRF